MILERNLSDEQFIAMDCKGSKRPRVTIKVRVIESPATRARAEKAVVKLGVAAKRHFWPALSYEVTS